MKRKTAVLLTLALLMSGFILAPKNILATTTKSSTLSGSSVVTPSITTIPKLAIVIDDFGSDNQTGVTEMLSIDAKITCAVMPGSKYTKQNATDAHNAGKEVIVHMPMQAKDSSPDQWYGTHPIRLRFSTQEAYTNALWNINDVPFADGVNIHTGSGCSASFIIMSGVMQAVKESKMYFLDSRTSQQSVCKDVAKEQNVDFVTRNIFLDDGNMNDDAIRTQMEMAIKTAKNRGVCVAIGHVGAFGGKDTARIINDMLPLCFENGVQIVYANELKSPA